MGENANDRFERLAAEFYAATGMLAPGKDQPSAMGGSREDYDRRVDAWRGWNAERTAQVERDAARWQAVRGLFVGVDDHSPVWRVRLACFGIPHCVEVGDIPDAAVADDFADQCIAAVAALVTTTEAAEDGE